MKIQHLLFSLGTCKEAFYRELVVDRDPYLMKEWNHDFFDTIVDIGANVGVFTLYSCMRHSGAKVFAYEPCRETFAHLVTTNGFLSNVKFINEALGDGSSLDFRSHKSYGSVQFHKPEEGEQLGYSIRSPSLHDMFVDNRIDKSDNYFVKIDSEGGERFLLEDKQSTAVLKGSCGSAIELHFPGTKNGDKRDFRMFPPWEAYNSWIRDNFNDSHDIVYHHSSKRAGYGTYVILRKGCEGRREN